MKAIALSILSVALALGATSCGYKTAGKASRLPQELHTIAGPGFVNQTQT